MKVMIVPKKTGIGLPLVSVTTEPDEHQWISVTCGFGTGENQLITYNCLGPDGKWLANADLPFTIEIQDY